MSDPAEAPDPAPRAVAFADATREWARIGAVSFGGPTAQIALLHRVLVEERRWLSEREFLDALGFCMLLPGPEAMQLATYAGWKLHGVRGGLVAGLLFVLPGALLVLALAIAYATLGQHPPALAALRGIQAAALVLVLEALIRMGRRALRGATHAALAIAAFAAVALFAVPFPIVVLVAGLVGFSGSAVPGSPLPAARVRLGATLRTALAGLAAWLLPLAAVALAFGPDHLLARLAAFFSRLAVVTFGGAYAVLAYMSQDVVTRHGWLTARAMIDALGLAETTPGPLILVTEFVGFLAAWRAAPEHPLAHGLMGAAVTLWATFAPCFLWIFAGAPYLGWIRTRPRLQGALAAITAAVLGVILHLAVWFGQHVLFARTAAIGAGPVRFSAPAWETLDPRMAALVVACGVLLLGLRWSVHRVIAMAALLGLLIAAR